MPHFAPILVQRVQRAAIHASHERPSRNCRDRCRWLQRVTGFTDLENRCQNTRPPSSKMESPLGHHPSPNQGRSRAVRTTSISCADAVMARLDPWWQVLSALLLSSGSFGPVGAECARTIQGHSRAIERTWIESGLFRQTTTRGCGSRAVVPTDHDTRLWSGVSVPPMGVYRNIPESAVATNPG